ncbi:alpha/beta fold hydrolase [Nonomuraea sp. NPDC050556]|uniref:alpha/beta fold hydrolase n=1 Tax=Nonomuraea sp. NPDC050556 TaxID=3364369 RepID=UPI0037897400
MRLHVTERGDGDRTAILIHGFSDDGDTWWRVAPELERRGYRVLMPDLRGFGQSPRAESYSAKEWAADLVENLPKGAEVVAGHSLGGRLLAMTVDELAPERAIYLDPAWAVPSQAIELADVAAFLQGMTREQIHQLNPRWSDRDLDVELSSFAAMDPRTAGALAEIAATPIEPGEPDRPSLLVLAENSQLVDPTTLKGFEVRTVTGAGHVMHRDDFDAFMAALDGWI